MKGQVMKQIFVTALIGLVTLVGCDKLGPAGGSRTSLSSEDDKTIYSIGVDMGTKLKTLQLSDKEMTALKMGIDDGVKGTKPEVDMQKYIMQVGNLIRTRAEKFAQVESKASEEFLTKAAGAQGAQKSESGLIYVETAAGTGPSPQESDRVKVNYHGTLRDGTVFDSTRERGNPATFNLNRVIKCWTEGVQKMKVGGKADLYCPAPIAYGDRGAPPKIPPGAALKFEVELIEIVKGDEGAGPGGPHGGMNPFAKGGKPMPKPQAAPQNKEMAKEAKPEDGKKTN